MVNIQTLFQVQGQTAVITGGSGVLGQAMAHALAEAGARVAIISRRAETSDAVARAINANGGQARGIACDVTDQNALKAAHEQVKRAFGSIDILINGAGGNQLHATTAPGRSFFDLSPEAIEGVFNLNFTGTILSSQVFGRDMAERGQGCIVNIASMSSLKPLTNVPVYSAAKSAVTNFTQWLAVHMAQEYSPNIRVNAMAPGFFLTEQNRFLLTDKESGEFTPRGQKILAHTPAGRLGVPEDLIGTLLWLISPASAFVTGIVVPVDGGFSAFGGV
ncbi:MAG: SDR family oxidoreductase [Ktedonobacteraceae bacterium]|nr:SDR family oxidoreductase [Ktedonobacteraceae bacterium]